MGPGQWGPGRGLASPEGSIQQFIAFQDEEEISTSPGVAEFVSDAFDTCSFDQEDLKKEMEQLVLDKQAEPMAVLEGIEQACVPLLVKTSSLLQGYGVASPLLQPSCFSGTRGMIVQGLRYTLPP